MISLVSPLAFHTPWIIPLVLAIFALAYGVGLVLCALCGAVWDFVVGRLLNRNTP